MSDENQAQRGRLSSTVLLSILFWVAALLLALGIFLFAKTSTIRVNGNSHYSADALLGGCGILQGERLYGIDTDEVEQTILKSFPMIESVSVERAGFSSVIIDVIERKPVYYTVYGGRYLYLSDNFYVLEHSDISPEQKGYPLLHLITPAINTGYYGQEIAFDTSDFAGSESYTGANYNAKMSAFLNELRKNAPLYSQLTSVRLTDPLELYAYIGSIEIYFDDDSNLSAKCTAIQTALAKHANSLSAIEKIHAQDANRILVRINGRYVES